ncbi:hypothetical protein ACFFV7_35755 [Nonomuraea spiralis]|uniref:Uncharacterized protein n=1 Tax=Nonomuraea spiralis TaxID=46182 RepID=A0ABV5IPW6_9ACTN|nr:hypothetical protein [Nonomuraea spiralis]GGT11162.1 hypothetical protein GCM10010176_064650 [Nonomuraea spiralis]
MPSNPITPAANTTGGSTWLQTDPLNFSHTINGADRVYERISEVPELKIPFPGVWEVSYNARPMLAVTSSANALFVHTAIFKNGAVIPGSEAVTGIQSPAHGSQNTAGQTFLHTFAAGDVVTLHGFRIGQAGTAAVASNSDGRTGVMAHWVAPGF